MFAQGAFVRIQVVPGAAEKKALCDAVTWAGHRWWNETSELCVYRGFDGAGANGDADCQVYFNRLVGSSCKPGACDQEVAGRPSPNLTDRLASHAFPTAISAQQE